jgi:hypothetical protein
VVRQKEDLAFANVLNNIRHKYKDEHLSESEISQNAVSVKVRYRMISYTYTSQTKTLMHSMRSSLCSGSLTIQAANIVHTRGGGITNQNNLL